MEPMGQQQDDEMRRRIQRQIPGGFRILPSKVIDSDAFNILSHSAKILLILSLSQLDHWTKIKNKHIPKGGSSLRIIKSASSKR